MSYTEGPRHATITADNRSALVQIVVWFLMVVMILATILRLTVRFATAHLPGSDDAAILIATATGIGQAISVSIAAQVGLGRRATTFNHVDVESVEKDIYTSNLLYTFTIAIAKVSTLLLIYRIAIKTTHQRLLHLIGIIMGLWTVAILVALSLQCGAKSPWKYGSNKCFKNMPFWISSEAVSMVTDVALVALPARIVWDLQMDKMKRAVVLSAFAFRVLLVPSQVVRLVCLGQLQNSTDPIYDALPFTIATQFDMTLAIVVSSIPALKPFMDRAASGMMGVSLGQREGTYGISNDYAMQTLSRQSKATGPSKNNERLVFRTDRAQHQTAVTASKRRPISGAQQIQRTVDVDVQYSDEVRLYRPSETREDSM